MTFTDIEEYNMRSIAISGNNIYSQITVATLTLPKAVLNTFKIFAVYRIERKCGKDWMINTKFAQYF